MSVFPLIRSGVQRRGRLDERLGDAVRGARRLRLVASGDDPQGVLPGRRPVDLHSLALQ